MAEVPVIDGYSDLVQVAKGGFGVVYRARQDRFGRTVALKVLSVADLDERGQRRFERECIAMGSLGWHPNVVAVFDSGITEDGHPWLSMEYLEGGSLGDRLRRGSLPWQEAVIAGVQVAGALDAAHAAGILHRDLKPENLLVGPYGETKLGDFGIAAVEGAARTTTGHASFTANHVAPEILRRQRPDERSDLYSLASTLHTLIAGEPPFAGDPDEPIEAIMVSVLQDQPPRLDGVPDGLADLLVRALAKDPADRPESAEKFGRDLQDVQVDAGLPVADLRLAPTTSSSAAAEPPKQIEPVPTPKPVVGDPLPTVDHQAPALSRGDPAPTIDHIPRKHPRAAQVTPAPPSESRERAETTESAIADSTTRGEDPSGGIPAPWQVALAVVRKPRTWFIAVPVVILLAVVVGPFVYFNVIQDDAPARASLNDLTTPTTDDGATTETTDGSGDTTAPSDSATIDGSWEVADGTGSFAGYRATEVLFGQSNEAAGRTEGVTGTLEIDGTTVTTATIEVDLTGLSSDESVRDGQVQNRILETGQFPTATFELTEPLDFGTEPDDQQEITVEATGDLTAHGETRTVTIDITARKNGAAIEVSGNIPVTWSDFSINDPSGGPAQVEDNGEIEFALSFAEA